MVAAVALDLVLTLQGVEYKNIIFADFGLILAESAKKFSSKKWSDLEKFPRNS